MPRKTFTSGSILTATDMNTYLMNQSVQTFTDATDRDTQIPTPTNGTIVYLSTPDQFYVRRASQWWVLPSALLPDIDDSTSASFTAATTGWTGLGWDIGRRGGMGYFSISGYLSAAVTAGATGNITNRSLGTIATDFKPRPGVLSWEFMGNFSLDSPGTDIMASFRIDPSTGQVFLTGGLPNITYGTTLLMVATTTYPLDR
jgi:hypothetical protein